MKRPRISLGIMVLILVTLLTACDKQFVFMGTSTNTSHKIKASYRLFTGTDEKKVRLKTGDTLAVDYQSKVKKGALSIDLYDPDDRLLQSLDTNQAGNEKIEASQDGVYRFEITGKSTRGSYEIKYKIE